MPSLWLLVFLAAPALLAFLRQPQEVRSLPVALSPLPPRWTAEQVRSKVNELTEGSAPGLSAVQKAIQKIKKREIDSRSKDQPWSLATLNQFPIPDDSVPVLIEALVYSNGEMDQPFTVREAIWVSRLSSCFTTMSELVIHAKNYAAVEQACEIIFGSFTDSSALDTFVYESLTGNIIDPEIKTRIKGIENKVYLNADYIRELVGIILKRQHDKRIEK